MTNAPSQSRTLCYEKVKIVEIARTSKSNKHPPIELRELQVYSGGINVAQQGLAYQTSDLVQIPLHLWQLTEILVPIPAQALQMIITHTGESV